MSTVKVKGLRELGEFMKQVPLKMRTNVMRGATRAGGKVVLTAARDNLASQGRNATGLLQAGLKISTRVRGDVVIASVRTGGPHGYIAKWLEYGVAAHRIAARAGGSLFFNGRAVKAVNHPGVQPQPFLRPALDHNAQAVLLATGKAIQRRLRNKRGLEGAADIELEAA